MRYFGSLKYILLVIEVIYIICIFHISAFEGLRHNFIAWLIFGICVLYTIFIWLAFGKRKKQHRDDDAAYEAGISQELFRERNKWF